MSQARFKQLIPHTEDVTKDKSGALNYRLERCHQGPRNTSIKCTVYDTVSAAICAVENSKGSPLLLKDAPTIIPKLIPHEAHNKSFVAKVEKALEFYSSKDAKEQLFEKKLVDGTNGKEFACFLNPHINKDGLAYSRYLVHRAFNRAHIYRNADHIDIDIIERCSKSRHPELLKVFIDRLKGLCHGSEDVDICTCYVRFIIRNSLKDAANSTTFAQHISDIKTIDPEFHDAVKECPGNLLLKDPASLTAPLRESDTDYELLEQSDLEDKTPTKWSQGQFIGSGSYGDVYLAFNDITGEVIAVKQVELRHPMQLDHLILIENMNKMTDEMRREVEFLHDLDHKNIVQYRGFKREGHTINIFLDYMSRVSLASHLERNGGIAESEARLYIAQCLEGLSYLHDKGIIHRKIKGANILLDHDQNVKISDFGLRKLVQSTYELSTQQLLPYWMAPELIRTSEHTPKADIWSLGCLVIEMVSGKPPFSNLGVCQAILQIGDNTKPEIPSSCSEELRSFLDLCFQFDPDKRASARDLLLHPFITEGH